MQRAATNPDGTTRAVDPDPAAPAQPAEGGRPSLTRRVVAVGIAIAVAAIAAIAVITSGPDTPDTPDTQPDGREPTGSKVLFSDSFDDDDWSEYHRVQNSFFAKRANKYDNDSYALRTDDGAARFEVRPGDAPGGGLGKGERSEVSQDSASWQAEEGDEWFVHERLRLAEDFEPGRWTIITQFHAGDGSPPLSLQVTRKGALVLASGGDAGEANEEDGKEDRVLVPAEEFMDMRGEWFDVTLHVRWSEDGDDGGTAAYVDGELVAPWREQQTMASSRIYWKAGIYRAPTDSTHVLWMDDVVISAGPERRR
ncbi:hypothetical protein E4P39_20565 [Blastococcus sp. CT_GayMR19]|uniref:heparin lyase I family protein n=1 Tax=Blastococcus sp. CT_GayMR19 TaxID=2559608 RepID=UPI00107458DE|nr:heparin lyase I family protein [Blastococcus sp. CT_GayMR19]TFV69938.1 hypothetical protein E4P39_20565 [Blastococcus sp. CT_GayMR19]